MAEPGKLLSGQVMLHCVAGGVLGWRIECRSVPHFAGSLRRSLTKPAGGFGFSELPSKPSTLRRSSRMLKIILLAQAVMLMEAVSLFDPAQIDPEEIEGS